HLQAIFAKLKEANLKLNLKKCFFFLPNIKFLEHVMRRDGLHPDEEK
ncbi:11248_t:CDS:1, partial [Racocetra persica]